MVIEEKPRQFRTGNHTEAHRTRALWGHTPKSGQSPWGTSSASQSPCLLTTELITQKGMCRCHSKNLQDGQEFVLEATEPEGHPTYITEPSRGGPSCSTQGTTMKTEPSTLSSKAPREWLLLSLKVGRHPTPPQDEPSMVSIFYPQALFLHQMG